MGIPSLLSLLKSISVKKHLRDYQNLTLGIDVYTWLHPAVYTCSYELANGIPTNRHIEFCVKRVDTILSYGIKKLVLVFDGRQLPSKQNTEVSREKNREDSKVEAFRLMSEGLTEQAHKKFAQSVDVTPQMAYEFIQAVKHRKNIECIVSPYEADAQLAYLSRIDYVDVVISEDSDLLAFGSKKVLFKLFKGDVKEMGDEITLANITNSKDPSLSGWTQNMFLTACILSGCDYLPSLKKLGINTAFKLVGEQKDYRKVLSMLSKYEIPFGYQQNFDKAFLTFRFQYVYCPIREKIVHINTLDIPGLQQIYKPNEDSVMFSISQFENIDITKEHKEYLDNVLPKQLILEILNDKFNFSFLGDMDGLTAIKVAKFLIDPESLQPYKEIKKPLELQSQSNKFFKSWSNTNSLSNSQGGSSSNIYGSQQQLPYMSQQPQNSQNTINRPGSANTLKKFLTNDIDLNGKFLKVSIRTKQQEMNETIPQSQAESGSSNNSQILGTSQLQSKTLLFEDTCSLSSHSLTQKYHIIPSTFHPLVSRKVPVTQNNYPSSIHKLGSLSLSASYSNPFPIKSSLQSCGNTNKTSVLLQLNKNIVNTNGISQKVNQKNGFFSSNNNNNNQKGKQLTLDQMKDHQKVSQNSMMLLNKKNIKLTRNIPEQDEDYLYKDDQVKKINNQDENEEEQQNTDIIGQSINRLVHNKNSNINSNGYYSSLMTKQKPLSYSNYWKDDDDDEDTDSGDQGDEVDRENKNNTAITTNQLSLEDKIISNTQLDLNKPPLKSEQNTDTPVDNQLNQQPLLSNINVNLSNKQVRKPFKPPSQVSSSSITVANSTKENSNTSNNANIINTKSSNLIVKKRSSLKKKAMLDDIDNDSFCEISQISKEDKELSSQGQQSQKYNNSQNYNNNILKEDSFDQYDCYSQSSLQETGKRRENISRFNIGNNVRDNRSKITDYQSTLSEEEGERDEEEESKMFPEKSNSSILITQPSESSSELVRVKSKTAGLLAKHPEKQFLQSFAHFFTNNLNTADS